MRLLIFFAALCLPCSLFGQSIVFQNTERLQLAQFDLILSEIMSDPDPSNGLPLEEYVEIFNRSLMPVDLSGWSLFDGNIRLLPSIIIQPGEYYIICAAADTALFSSYGNYIPISSISLTNTGEKISLRDFNGNPIDSVTYSDAWFGSSYKKDGGWSLERIDINFTCYDEINWKPSENSSGGTPGSLNSISGLIVDNSDPVLLRSYCPDSISAILIFNEALDVTTISQISNYNFNFQNTLLSATALDAGNKRILLTFQNNIPDQFICKSFLTGITDCSGNFLPPGTVARFGIANSDINNKVIINEILFNPHDGGYDYIELYHKGSGIIDLKNLKIASLDLATGLPDEVENISDEPFCMFPGDYIVLSENPIIVSTQYSSSFPYNFITVSELPAMNADEGHIALMQDQTFLEHVIYNEDFHFNLIKDVKGISLEKINPDLSPLSEESWHSAAPSAGFGTPGHINSQFSKTGFITKEVSAIPEIFSPDYDGIDDIIMFSLKTGNSGNISNIRIYNASGQMIYSNAKNTLIAPEDILTWNGICDNGELGQAGIYIAVIEIFNLNGEVNNYKLPFVLAVRF